MLMGVFRGYTICNLLSKTEERSYIYIHISENIYIRKNIYMEKKNDKVNMGNNDIWGIWVKHIYEFFALFL